MLNNIMLGGRYYVLYDYSTDSAIISGHNSVYDTFTFLVASFDNKEDATDMQDAINRGTLDMMKLSGPWLNMSPALGENEFIEDDYNLSNDSVDYGHY